MRESHGIAPVYNKESRVLILGTFPSVKSRAAGFYYAHPQNRFWRMLAAVYGEETPASTEEKTAFLLGHGIALWDVAESCDIAGSADSAIRNAVPNDIGRILDDCPIERILLNGGTAGRLYDRLLKPVLGRDASVLPSTSPANAAWSLERLTEAWGKALR